MRHRFDLRMQDGMIDQARNAMCLSRPHNIPSKTQFLTADIRADVIDRLDTGHGVTERLGILETANTDLGDPQRLERCGLLRLTNQAAHGPPLRGKRSDDRIASLAGSAGNQNHRDLVVSSNRRFGLSGISNSSIFLSARPRASSMACANNGPTGIAP